MMAMDDETLRAYAPAGLCMMGVEESGEDSTCGQPATHKITGPHDYDPDHWYCEAHGREVHEGIEYRHRWRLEPLPGVAWSMALAAEVLRLRERVAALQDERDRVVQEREAFGLRASAAERERDEARAERDALRARPTYEARAVAPTDAEWRGHLAAGGSWLVLRPTWSPLVVVDPDTYPGLLHTHRATWLPLGAYGLPCAWPVVAAEVMPL